MEEIGCAHVTNPFFDAYLWTPATQFPIVLLLAIVLSLFLCSPFPHPAPIVLALIVTCTYIEPFPCYLETLVSTSCLQVSPHVFRSVHTSLNTYTCLQSCLLSFAPAFTVHRVPALLPVSLSVPPPRSTAVVTMQGNQVARTLRRLHKRSNWVARCNHGI